MNQLKILTYHLSQLSCAVQYSISVRYQDILFCLLSDGVSFKNIEFIFSYSLPVSKWCSDGNDCQRYSNRHCTSSDSGVVIEQL